MVVLHSRNISENSSLDFKILFESVPGLYLVLDPDLNIIAVSDAYLKATMTEREVIVGRYLFDMFPDNPNDVSASGKSNLNASLQRVLKNKIPDSMAVQKYDIRQPGAGEDVFEERYWSPINSPVLDKDNNLIAIIHRVEDVTEFVKLRSQDERLLLAQHLGIQSEKSLYDICRRSNEVNEAAQKLHESEERYKLATQGARDGLWDWNVNTDELFWSDRFKEMLEITSPDFRPHYDEFKKRLHLQDKARIIEELENHTKTGAPYDAQFRMYSDTGKLVWIRARGASVWDEEGMATRMSGSVTDITEHKRAEESLKASQKMLQESEERYKLALNGSNDGLWDRNAITNEIYWSDRLREIMGVGPDYKPHFDEFNKRIHPDDIDCVRQARDKHQSDRLPYDVEYRALTEAGHYIWLHIRGRGIWNEDGKLIRMLGSATDITDKKEAEENLKAARAQAEEANQAKSEFLANMSHELRTPLNSILGLSRILYGDKAISGDHRDMAGVVYKSAKSLLNIVNDILDLSKIEAGKLALENISFSLEEVVHNVVDAMMPLSSEKGLIFESHFSEKSMPYLRGDPARLGRILINLIGNAIKYTDKGSVTLDVEFEHSGPQQVIVECHVTDTGIGIAADKQERIFEKFEQADSTITRKYGGTGLGLNITKQLIDKMGGQIGLESVEGKGSCFWFRISFETADERPVIDRDAFKRPHIEASPSEPRINASEVKILVAEDHNLNQLYMKKLLEMLGIRHFDLVENGAALLERLKSDPCDLILMDCHMPLMSGYEATEIIREQEKENGQHIPIIAMTADAMVGTRAKCIKAGMDDYISKPLDNDELYYLLSRWISFDHYIADLSVGAGEDEGRYDLTLIEQFTDNEMELEEYIKVFIEQAEDILRILKKNCIDGERKEWVEAAHKLKGGAGMMRAQILMDSCDQAQKMMIASQYDRMRLFDMIQEEYHKLKKSFQARGLIKK